MTFAQLKEHVATYSGVSLQQIDGVSRKLEIVMSRYLLWYIGTKQLQLTLSYMGENNGSRSRATVHCGLKKFEIDCSYNKYRKAWRDKFESEIITRLKIEIG